MAEGTGIEPVELLHPQSLANSLRTLQLTFRCILNGTGDLDFKSILTHLSGLTPHLFF